MIATRRKFPTAYQDATPPRRYYRTLVEKVRAAEAPLSSTAHRGRSRATYSSCWPTRDEYEVARLHTDPRFHEKIAAQFEGDYKVFHRAAGHGKEERPGRTDQAALRRVDAVGLRPARQA